MSNVFSETTNKLHSFAIHISNKNSALRGRIKSVGLPTKLVHDMFTVSNNSNIFLRNLVEVQNFNLNIFIPKVVLRQTFSELSFGAQVSPFETAENL